MFQIFNFQFNLILIFGANQLKNQLQRKQNTEAHPWNPQGAGEQFSNFQNN